MPPTKQLKNKAIDAISKLPQDRLREVVDFVEYLERKEEVEATKEILSDKKLLEGIKAGIEDLKAGRIKQWRSVRKEGCCDRNWNQRRCL
jgi:sulfopyruvate decarboxylase TPP-binding subunit